MLADIKQMEFIDGTLSAIACDLEKVTGLTFTITSIHRIGDTGVHGQLPVRGIDLRMHNEDVGKAVETLVNDRWAYDPSRPNIQCAVLHGPVLHLHLQAHPQTVRRSK